MRQILCARHWGRAKWCRLWGSARRRLWIQLRVLDDWCIVCLWDTEQDTQWGHCVDDRCRLSGLISGTWTVQFGGTSPVLFPFAARRLTFPARHVLRDASRVWMVTPMRALKVCKTTGAGQTPGPFLVSRHPLFREAAHCWPSAGLPRGWPACVSSSHTWEARMWSSIAGAQGTWACSRLSPPIPGPRGGRGHTCRTPPRACSVSNATPQSVSAGLAHTRRTQCNRGCGTSSVGRFRSIGSCRAATTP